MKDSPEIELDHIGVAVTGISEALKFWSVLGWSTHAHRESVPDQRVEVGMLPLGNHANIELLEPTSKESTVAKFLEKRGPGIHHLCLRVKNIDELLKKLKAAQIKLINETPVAGAGGKRVAFIHPSSTGGLLIELSEPKVGR